MMVQVAAAAMGVLLMGQMLKVMSMVPVLKALLMVPVFWALDAEAMRALRMVQVRLRQMREVLLEEQRKPVRCPQAGTRA